MAKNQGAQQLKLFSADEEAELYHNTQQGGYFSVLVQYSTHEKRQSSHPLVEMPQVLEHLDPYRDTWLSQAEFTKPNRRVVNLLRLGLLFIDLDTYHLPWAQGKSPEAQADAVVYYCQQEGIPEPSLIVFSGRGLQAKWLLDLAIPRYALPRWNACQRSLIDKLSSLGADPAARDASRVLRLVNTTNTKSGEVCRVVFVKEDNGLPIRYNFEYLAEALLPVAREEIERQRQTKKLKQNLTLLQGNKKGYLRGFSGRQLAWHRLEDLRTLASLRGGVSEGERMRHLFWQLNFLLLSGATYSNQMYHEAKVLSQELDKNWNHNSKELITLYQKAKAYEAGETIEFQGKKYPPLYTPKNDALINLFQITTEEQKQLKTIISRDISRERHREREQQRRQAIKKDETRLAHELEKQKQREQKRRETIKKDEARLAHELEKQKQREQKRRETIKKDEARLAHELEKQKQREQKRRETIKKDEARLAHELEKQKQREQKRWAAIKADEARTAVELEKKKQREQKRREDIKADKKRLEKLLEQDRQRKKSSRKKTGATDRKEYESNAINQQKPWKKLSMSRANWYRKGKPINNG